MSDCFNDGQGQVALGSGTATYSLGGVSIKDTLPNIQYSYEACGDVNRYSEPELILSDTNLTLRVSVPLTASPSNHFWRTDVNGALQADGAYFNGPVWDLVRSFQTDFGIRYIFQEISQASLAAAAAHEDGQNDTWRACRYEIAIGATDLCLGDFVVTTEHRNELSPHATFSAPFAAAEFVLVVPKQNEESSHFFHLSGTVINPFSWDAWLLFFGCVLIHTLGYWMAEFSALKIRLEATKAQKKATDKAAEKAASSTSSIDAPGGRVVTVEGEKSTVEAPATGKKHHWSGTTWTPKKGTGVDAKIASDPMGDDLISSLYNSLSLIRPTTPYSPKSHGSRVVHLGYKAFLLVSVALYTSSVTRALVAATLGPTATFTTLGGAANREILVCAHGDIESNFASGQVAPPNGADWVAAEVQNIFVGRNGRGPHPYTTHGDLSAMLDPAGYCGAAVVRQSEFIVERFAHPEACSLRAIPGSVIPEETVALPVARWAEAFISLGVQRVLDQSNPQRLTYTETVSQYGMCRAIRTLSHPNRVQTTQRLLRQRNVAFAHTPIVRDSCCLADRVHWRVNCAGSQSTSSRTNTVTSRHLSALLMWSIGCTALGVIMTQIPAFAGTNIPDFISKWSVSGHAVSHAAIHAPHLIHHGIPVGVHGFGFHDPDAAAGHEGDVRSFHSMFGHPDASVKSVTPNAVSTMAQKPDAVSTTVEKTTAASEPLSALRAQMEENGLRLRGASPWL